MPSGITHMILSKVLKDGLFNKSKEDGGGKYTRAYHALQRNPGAFLVGSVAPDLPYISIGDDNIADCLHYTKTNEVPQRGFAEAANFVKVGKLEQAEALFCFNAGHFSHLVADGIMHPYVRDKVGDYKVAQVAHRTLEMKLDVLVALRYYDLEVKGTKFQNELDWINDCEFKEEIFTSFSGNISSVYNLFVARDKVEAWIIAMRWLFDVVAGDFPEWYSNHMGDKGKAIKDYNSVKKEEGILTNLDMPIDANKNKLSTNFTGIKDRKVHFFDDAVKKYFDVFPDMVLSAYESVFNGQGDVDIPAIDLDTGRSLKNNQLTEIPTLWS